jgi:hypothetical protein
VIGGKEEIVTDGASIERVYREYSKTHPFMMLFIGRRIRNNFSKGAQVLIRVHPDEPNPLAGVTDPVV